MCSPGINGEGELRGNWLTQVHLEKWPLEWCVCVCVCVLCHALYLYYHVLTSFFFIFLTIFAAFCQYLIKMMMMMMTMIYHIMWASQTIKWSWVLLLCFLGWGVTDRTETCPFLCRLSIIMPNFVTVAQTVCRYIGGPQKIAHYHTEVTVSQIIQAYIWVQGNNSPWGLTPKRSLKVTGYLN